MDEKLKAYAEHFGEGFPTIPLAWGRTDKEIAKIIDECLEKDQTVYQLGYAKESEVY